MNKARFTQSFTALRSDQGLFALLIVFAIIAVIYSLLIGLSIHPSDVTVYSRYTAFGEAHFYKSHWQYLLSFLGFGLLVAATHITLMFKLNELGRRQTAVLVAWTGIAILAIAALYTLGVLSLGRAA